MTQKAVVGACHLIAFSLLIVSFLSVNGQMLWPKPQFQSNPGSTLTIDSQSFTFTTSGVKSDLLTDTITRYNPLIFYGQERGHHNKLNNPQASLISLDINVKTSNMNVGTASENYTLTIQSSKSILVADTIYGAMRGLETFSQLVTYTGSGTLYTVVATNIVDYPRFAWRGILIDSSRHFLSIPTILNFIDAMSYSKFNVLHWHLVDDESFPYQSVVLPKLSQVGAYAAPSLSHVYTPQQIASIIYYAQTRGVRVVPEFDSPAHTASWGAGYPEILTPCYTNNKPNGERYAVNPIQSYTWDFLLALFTELSKLFPDQYIHVGGDELDFTCWQSNPDLQNFMKQNGWTQWSQLEAYYEAKVLATLSKVGKSYTVWEDVFDNGVQLAADTVIEVWKENWNDTIAETTAAGYRSILSSPWYLNYISYGADWVDYYAVEPTDFTGTTKQKELVIGGECCFWGEFIDSTNLLARAWPRACAISERLWSSINVTDTTDAQTRLHNHRCRYIRRGIPAEPASGPSFCPLEWS